MTTETTLKYALVRYQPDRARHEVVNIGVVLFTTAGPVLSVASNLTKLLAIDPNLSLLQVQEDAGALDQALQVLWKSGASAESVTSYFGHAMCGATLSDVGQIAPQNRSVELIVEELQRALVFAPVKKKKQSARASRLNSELRAIFRSAKILGKEPGDIGHHMVVPNFPIDSEVGLFAEFALRNGKLRVTETVDFRGGEPSTKKREAESKTLVLLQALEIVGKSDLHRSVVVSGASEKIQPSISLLSRHADDLIVRESAEDWGRYIDMMAQAAKLPAIQ